MAEILLTEQQARLKTISECEGISVKRLKAAWRVTNYVEDTWSISRSKQRKICGSGSSKMSKQLQRPQRLAHREPPGKLKTLLPNDKKRIKGRDNTLHAIFRRDKSPSLPLVYWKSGIRMTASTLNIAIQQIRSTTIRTSKNLTACLHLTALIIHRNADRSIDAVWFSRYTIAVRMSKKSLSARQQYQRTQAIQ